MGGAGAAAARAVPVLRPARRHGPVAAVRWKRGRATTSPNSTNVYTGDDARGCAIDPAGAPRQGHRRRPDAGARLLRQHRARRVHGRRGSTRPASRRARSPPDPGHRATAALRRASRPARSRCSSPSTCSTRASTCPRSTRSCSCGPTESATVFLQQLGRGLRLADDKPCLTVLDFIGSQHGNFRFDLRYRALTGVNPPRARTRGRARLPRSARPAATSSSTGSPGEIVLDNLRASLRVDWNGLVAELRQLGDCSLAEFLEETGLEIEDVYRRQRGGWAGLRRLAGLETRPMAPDDTPARAGDRPNAAHGRPRPADLLTHCSTARPPTTAGVDGRPARLLRHAALRPLGLERAARHSRRGPRAALGEAGPRRRARQLAEVLRARHPPAHPARRSRGAVPLRVHARYSRDERLAAFGVPNPRLAAAEA